MKKLLMLSMILVIGMLSVPISQATVLGPFPSYFEPTYTLNPAPTWIPDVISTNEQSGLPNGKLVNGYAAWAIWQGTGDIVGWSQPNQHAEATVSMDLQRVRSINQVRVHCLGWGMLPNTLEVKTSVDGITYTAPTTVPIRPWQMYYDHVWASILLTPREARYVDIKLTADHDVYYWVPITISEVEVLSGITTALTTPRHNYSGAWDFGVNDDMGKLTDGFLAWVPWQNGVIGWPNEWGKTDETIDLDLGSERILSGVRAYCLSFGSVTFPDTIGVSTSEDGILWTAPVTVKGAQDTDFTDYYNYGWNNVTMRPQEARYVRMTLTRKGPEYPPDGWGKGLAVSEVEMVLPATVDEVFLSPNKVNVSRNAEHSFKIHVISKTNPLNVSEGDLADVTVNGVSYDAVVSGVDVAGAATDIAIKVYVEDANGNSLLVDNDPTVAIYSINGIGIVDSVGVINDLVLDTFSPRL